MTSYPCGAGALALVFAPPERDGASRNARTIQARPNSVIE